MDMEFTEKGWFQTLCVLVWIVGMAAGAIWGG